MQGLLPRAETLGALLKARGETVAVSESSSGGLVSAALLAVPGASAWFMGGAVVYTQPARTVRARLGTTWGIAETGAAGPGGNRYGDAPGHTCLAVSGPHEKAITVETGSADRVANMRAFAAAMLDLLAEAAQAHASARG